ncbi:MAG: hypothetical protein L7F78_16860, partial [Syntrophales bacterium LBB04]|nr:hypothetical protein [Syntrophales bacterium LBB04]
GEIYKKDDQSKTQQAHCYLILDNFFLCLSITDLGKISYDSLLIIVILWQCLPIVNKLSLRKS